jgi:hypothetical protein
MLLKLGLWMPSLQKTRTPLFLVQQPFYACEYAFELFLNPCMLMFAVVMPSSARWKAFACMKLPTLQLWVWTPMA